MQAAQVVDLLPGYATRWKGLAFIGMSVIVMSMDNTILNNSLPVISSELHASKSDLQWVVDAYILAFAALLLTMGAVGDRIGRKRALQIGLMIFGLGSLAAALAHSMGVLIAARAFLGVGAATIMPATLSIISATFPAHERPQAIAMWAAIFSLGIGVGPPLGGWLVQTFGWNSIFLVNVPVMLVALAGGALYLADSRNDHAPRPDFLGVALSIAGLISLIYAIIEAGIAGWNAAVLGAFGAALVSFSIFVWWENRNPDAMLPLHLFRNKSFSGANMVLGFVMFSLFGSVFFMSQYLQTVLGFSPWDAGIRSLPAAIPMTLAATVSARIALRLGTKHTVALGIGLCSLALLYMALVYQVDTPYEIVVIGQLLLGVGMGVAISPATNSIMGSVPVRHAGVGSAMNMTTRQLGGALGVAVLGAILNAVYLDSVNILKVDLPSLSAEQFQSISSSIQAAHGFALQSGLPAEQVQLIIDTTRQAFVTGMGRAILIGAIIMGLTALATLALLPAQVRPPEEAHTPQMRPEEAMAAPLTVD